MQSTFLSGDRTIRIEAALPSSPGPHPAVLLLHGSGGSIGFWFDRIAPLLNQHHLALFALHYFDSTGTLRANASHFSDGVHIPAWLSTIKDALAHIESLPEIDATRIALLGISLGAFLALSLGSESTASVPGPVRAIVEISGGLIPPWDKQANSSFPPTLILHGESDSIVSVSHARSLEEILTRLQVEHETLILAGEEHLFTFAAQRTMLAATTEFFGKHLR